jgi:thymidylate kinase
VAVCGLDGTGKSSLVKSLTQHFSQHFSVKSLHLGRPPPSVLSFILQPFFALRSHLRRFVKDRTNEIEVKVIAKEISTIYAIRSVLLAFDRKAASRRAFNLSKKGYLVICDRYPSLVYGKMDSPRIQRNHSRGLLYQYCYRLEKHLYNSILPTNMVFHLQAPVEVAIERNNGREKLGKETEGELRKRFLINSGVIFLGGKYIFVDACAPKGMVFSEVSNQIWFEGICESNE